MKIGGTTRVLSSSFMMLTQGFGDGLPHLVNQRIHEKTVMAMGSKLGQGTEELPRNSPNNIIFCNTYSAYIDNISHGCILNTY